MCESVKVSECMCKCVGVSVCSSVYDKAVSNMLGCIFTRRRLMERLVVTSTWCSLPCEATLY